MTDYPAAAFLDVDQDVGPMKSGWFIPIRNFALEQPGGSAEQSLTISSGAVTPANGASRSIVLAGEGSADDILDNITLTNWPVGTIGILRGNGTDVITLNHGNGGSGQLLLRDSVDYLLDTDDKRVAVQRVGTDLLEIWRSHAKVFESAGLTLAGNTSTSYTHNLGGEPDVIEGILECVTAEHNFSIGDRIRLPRPDGGATSESTVWADTTQIHIITVSAGYVLPLIHNKTTRAAATITAANWAFKVRAWRV